MEALALNDTFTRVGNKVEASVPARKNGNESMADEMKALRKRRLSRKVLGDPSLAAKLVAVESSPVYNTRGELLQAVSTNLGSV